MTNEQIAEYIGLLAKAQADNSYLMLRNILREFTLDELRTVQKVVNGLADEINTYERTAS